MKLSCQAYFDIRVLNFLGGIRPFFHRNLSENLSLVAVPDNSLVGGREKALKSLHTSPNTRQHGGDVGHNAGKKIALEQGTIPTNLFTKKLKIWEV